VALPFVSYAFTRRYGYGQEWCLVFHPYYGQGWILRRVTHGQTLVAAASSSVSRCASRLPRVRSRMELAVHRVGIDEVGSPAIQIARQSVFNRAGGEDQ